MASAHTPSLEQLSERWKITMALGVIFLVVGIVAIVVPAAASVGVAIFLGWVLVFGAIVQLFSAFSVEGTAGMVIRLVLAVLMAAAGIYLLVAPLKGTITLTVVLTIWFIATGIVRLFTAFRDRGTPAAGAMAVSGGVALILGILVALNLPSSASWALGLLVGLDFLCFGWVLLVLANAARKLRAAR
ncbi:MAG TPA: HdeD family acid-resistance protein [Solirubrobacteraceae bacterium]|nr:HdeD family acid-resistance protein [Solirubrobacteraceae bacterium]